MAARLVTVFLLSILLWPQAAGAQARLTVAEAIDIAVKRNPALRAARAEVDRAAADADVARSTWWPDLTLTESLQRGNQPVFVFGARLAAERFTAEDFAVSRLNAPGAASLFSTKLFLDQLVFDGGRTPSAISAAAAVRDVAAADADAATALMVLSVTKLYGELLSGQSSLRALDAGISSAAEDLLRAERRRAAGSATDADVLAASVQLADMRQRRLKADADLASSRAQLNRLMAEPVETSFDVVESPPAPAPRTELAALFKEAESGRPELRRAQAQVRAAEARERQARAVWWPQVRARAGVEWNGLRAGDRAGSWVIGGEAQWSVSLSGGESARRRSALASRHAATAAKDDLRAAIHVEVLTSLRRLDAALARIAVGAAGVAQSEERARVVRNRYEAGLAPITDVLVAASAALDAESRRVAAVVDALVAGAELDRALGRLPRS